MQRNFKPKQCVSCGDTFKPNSGKQEFCDYCRSIECEVCGKCVRVLPSHNRRFCSWECAREAKVKAKPERLWDRLVKNGECWEWTGASMVAGYGIIWHEGHIVGTHRLAFELHHGRKLDSDDVIRHTCDNPPCCNPAHLQVGTHADNVRDKISKGRQGEGNAKLTEDDVRWLRERYLAGGITQLELATELGVSRPAVSMALSRKNWRHVK